MVGVRVILVFVLLCVMTIMPASADARYEIGVRIEGEAVSFANQRPAIVDGRTLVPIRGVFEHLGFEVSWETHAPRTATLENNEYVVHITVGSEEFTVNGRRFTLDVPAQLIGGSTMLPIRAVLEAVGMHVGWHAGVNVVMISSEPVEDSPTHITIGGTRLSTAVTSLNLSNMGLGNADVAELRHFIDLRDLNLSGNQLTDFSWLRNLTRLTSLTANNMGLTDINALTVHGLRNLNRLSINDNNIRDIASLSQLESLTHLFASNNFIRDWSSVDHVANVTRGRQRLSSITLPNRRLTGAERQEWITDYWNLGGPTYVELDFIVLLNNVRQEHGLSQVEMCNTLMMAARFYSQQMSNLQTGLSHNAGPYADAPGQGWYPWGASYNVASAFGANLRWGGGNAFQGWLTAQGLIDGWMGSYGHRRYILSPEHNFIGIGQYNNFSYLFLSERPSTP